MKRKFLPVLALLILAGCAALPEIPSPGALRANLESPPVPSTLKGTGEFRLRSPDGLGALRFAFLVAAPDRLRVQALSPFGNLAFLLVQNQEKLQIYVPLEHLLLEDEEARSFLNRFLPPEIGTANLIYFLSGRLPDSLWARQLESVSSEGSTLKLRLPGSGGWAEAEYSRRRLQLMGLKVFNREERLSYQVKFKNYRDRAGFLLPARIEFLIPGPEGETSVRMDFLELEVNPELAEDSFRIPARESSTP
ncbi:MAG: DUF4292 domain-containing protein [Proteobacteria bacterium]|nr:DUF4292 domain-containing protein [Pseudomonadota bacterium]